MSLQESGVIKPIRRPHPGSIRDVVDGGYCIGCGACTSVMPNTTIVFNKFGDLVAQLPLDATSDELAAGTRVCPFATSENETAIAAKLFNDAEIVRDDELGSFIGTYAAYSRSARADGSSGGIATWILTTLLERQLIDYAINVGASPGRADGRFFSYRVTDDAQAVREGSTSFYYPVSMDEVLGIVRSRPGRYAVTGVPCFHKALRLLRAEDPLLEERIKFQIGIVCGQMKSAHYLEYLTQLAGGSGELRSACFRRKVAGARADDYAFEAKLQKPDNTIQTVQVLNSRIGVNWGMGYFKPQACDFCDDVLAETADIAVMDAWLPKYVGDGLGWSLVATRTRDMNRLLEQGHSADELCLERVDASAVADSQRGGLNHRRKALPYRLWLRKSTWRPQKRIEARDGLPLLLRIEQRLREYLRSRSRSIWAHSRPLASTKEFQRGMRVAEFAYRVLGKLKRMLRTV